MATHFMIIMSHYSRGLRIGWHYSEEGQLDKNKINSLLSSIKKKSGNTQFGIHKLSTDSVKLESVIKKDQFFKDVIFTEDENEFVNYVASDQSLTPHDISKYILSIWPSSHLKLQKLIYYCYAEFLLKTGEKLFREPIVSYKYGPVVESVFKKFKVHGSSVIDYKEDEKFIIKPGELSATPSFIKVSLSEHGADAIKTIIDVLEKYAADEPFELVEKTHRDGGPWSRVYKEGLNKEITDELIINYHDVVR